MFGDVQLRPTEPSRLHFKSFPRSTANSHWQFLTPHGNPLTDQSTRLSQRRKPRWRQRTFGHSLLLKTCGSCFNKTLFESCLIIWEGVRTNEIANQKRITLVKYAPREAPAFNADSPAICTLLSPAEIPLAIMVGACVLPYNDILCRNRLC